MGSHEPMEVLSKEVTYCLLQKLNFPDNTGGGLG